MITFECKRCGKCCQGDTWLRNLINPGDIEMWKKLGRDDILKFVCACCNRFIDPDNNNMPWKKQNCPFLEFHNGQALCRIYEVRPQTCRNFPINECENPKCPEKFHLHTWLWNGNCEAAKKFRIDMVRAIEDDIKI
jgi:Fe-S-cluster containining protein